MSEIVVRHVETTDAQALYQLYSQPKAYRDTLQLPLPSIEQWHKRLANLEPGTHNLVACIDGQVVGQLGLLLNQRVRRRHVATFGIGVDDHHHGKGVGSSLMKAMIDLCDNWAAIERIELTVFTDNQAAIALYRKFGFEIEGTSRAYAIRDGELVDSYHMARFRSEQRKNTSS
ncbi:MULTISPECIES: GNAT family N-acetyltransferase [Serratia]|jgi:putative acetyltransferase|uniref:GCN5 family acetyltransferase n=2 Tax=Serratia grimesii TaxID=82995 RepID=A0ABR4U608_9GAMM|nr:GNAT family N-acetyltransferase [Serratia grimesii]KFB86934.1 GCN5 family acetyltransferase [Serratia grimesii]CAI1132443.1 Spermine/spermidine acetyltransferase [Serratia grimesii]CAI1173176.1 Spermine/spermidine acetyltransferase [Serratia grimesii]CAI1184248.1 Spermine/spermidine acetyltransferase [Serratia grimesii]CAI1931699.1 Spermine/spermidine acetyltransferase [Serratia grimesii]